MEDTTYSYTPNPKNPKFDGKKLGKVIDYTATTDNFTIQQIIVKRPLVKSFVDPELTIHRKEIVEITDYKIIVKDEEKIIKQYEDDVEKLIDKEVKKI